MENKILESVMIFTVVVGIFTLITDKFKLNILSKILYKLFLIALCIQLWCGLYILTEIKGLS